MRVMRSPPDAVTGGKDEGFVLAPTVNRETTYGKLGMITGANGTARRGHGMLQGYSRMRDTGVLLGRWGSSGAACIRSNVYWHVVRTHPLLRAR